MIFIQENAFEIVVCNMAVILFSRQYQYVVHAGGTVPWDLRTKLGDLLVPQMLQSFYQMRWENTLAQPRQQHSNGNVVL